MITHIPGIQTRKLNIFQRMLVFNKFNHLYFTLFKITFKVKINYHDNHWQQPWSSWWCPQEISLYFWKHLPESSGQGTVQHYPFSLFSPLSKKFYNKYSTDALYFKMYFSSLTVLSELVPRKSCTQSI